MSQPAIIAEDLHKAFGSLVVLDGVSFALERGRTLVVLGRSGTGKSVLLKTIVGLLDPDRGRVQVLGQDLHRLDEAGRLRARRRMGYVFQDGALFDSLSVADNVGFQLIQDRRPAGEVRRMVDDALEQVGLSHVGAHMPSELSGGMRKRVGVARAIVARPELVLYDEPTSGLDPLTTGSINRIVRDLQRSHGSTAIVVTHDMASAFLVGDRIIMLRDGRIVADGDPAAIRAHGDPWVQAFIGTPAGSVRGGTDQVTEAVDDAVEA